MNRNFELAKQTIEHARGQRESELSLNGLDLSDEDLTILMPEIIQLTQLTKLDLSFNRLTTLPQDIGKLTELRFLSIEKINSRIYPTVLAYFQNSKY